MSFQGLPSSLPEENLGNEKQRCQHIVKISGYEIECEIGHGGMATVYRAVQQSLGCQVAIKLLAHELNNDSEFAERFKKEGQILAQLSHPNIITVYDIGISQEDRLFLSVEYLSGGTLKDRIEQGLSIDSALQIIRSIAKALSCAHQNGVIHRDVKPSNIMFRYDGSPVLTDFGVARTIGAKTIYTAAGLIVGSPGYMSPEQATGESATIQSDLYGLGVVLYEMLVGHPPYQASNPLVTILKHLNDPLPELPDQYCYIQPILNRLMAKKAADRYQNADEFLDEIDRIIPIDAGTQPKINPTYDDKVITESLSEKNQKKRLHFFVSPGIIGAIILAIAIGYNFHSTTKTTDFVPQNLANLAEKKTPTRSDSDTEIPALLQQADSQLKAGLLTETGQRAEASYRQVLKIDYDNAQALAGLENIAKEYERLARQRMEAGVLQESFDHLKKGLSIAPKLEELLRLRQEIEQRAAKISNQKMEQDRQREAQIQAQQFLTQAKSSFRENSLQVTLAHIEQGLLAVPNHPELLALREQVRARIIEQQHQVAARQQQEEEVQRQAKIAEHQKIEQERRQTEANQCLARALNDQKAGRYTASLQQVDKGLAAVPNHEGLLKLKEQIHTEALAAQQKKALHRQTAKIAKEKKTAQHKPTKTSSAGESDATMKKLQDIRNSVNALNQSLIR